MPGINKYTEWMMEAWGTTIEETSRRFLEYVKKEGIEIIKEIGNYSFAIPFRQCAILCQMTDKGGDVILTLAPKIKIKPKDIEESIRIYRTINSINFNVNSTLQYEIEEDGTFIIEASADMFVYDVYVSGYISDYIKELLGLPKHFFDCINKNYAQIENDDICNVSIELHLPEVIHHRDEIMSVLTELGCSPNVAEDEANFIEFSFQEYSFGLHIDLEYDYITLYKNGWYEFEMSDIDKLSEVKRRINEFNSMTIWNLSYRRDMEEHKYCVFTNAGLRYVSKELLGSHLLLVLDEFFFVKRNFIRMLNLFDCIRKNERQ